MVKPDFDAVVIRETANGRGRGLFVREHVAAGSVVFSENAIAWAGTSGTMSDGSSQGPSASVDGKCDGCLIGPRAKRCSACKCVAFCSTECFRVAWRAGHKHDCPILRASRNKHAPAEFMRLAVRLMSLADHEDHIGGEGDRKLRLSHLAAERLGSGVGEGSSVGGQEWATGWRLDMLCSDRELLNDSDRANTAAMATKLAAAQSSVEGGRGHVLDKGTDARGGDGDAGRVDSKSSDHGSIDGGGRVDSWETSQAGGGGESAQLVAEKNAAGGLLPVKGTRGEAWYDLICRMRCNVFATSDEELRTTGSAVIPICSTINHACDPSCAIIFSGSRATVRALRTLVPGEEVTISYCDLSLPKHLRRTSLEKSHRFKCECAACCRPNCEGDAPPGDVSRHDHQIYLQIQQAEAEQASALAEGRYAAATACAATLVEAYQACLPPRHPLHGIKQAQLGKLQNLVGRPSDAATTLQSAIGHLDVTHGRGSHLRAEAARCLDEARACENSYDMPSSQALPPT